MRQKAFVLFRDPLLPTDILNQELEREFGDFAENERQYFLELEKDFLTTFDIPGVIFSDISIELEGNKLFVSADRKNLLVKDGFQMKKYQFSLDLPKNIEQENITAHYENGVLTLTVPKVHKSQAKKKIEVFTGANPKAWTNFLNLKKNETQKLAN